MIQEISRFAANDIAALSRYAAMPLYSKKIAQILLENN